ncbi:MAG: glycosyltransferase family 8 protein [Hyphomonadaceae bacterium]
MSERIDIALGFDGRYVPHAANVMASVVRHAPDAKFRFIVLQADVTPEQKKRMEAVAPHSEFVWADVGDDMPTYTRGHLNRAVLFRLGLEALAPADCRRVLYIDADTIVVGDVRELWSADLGVHPVGAVTDCYQDADEFAELWDLPKGGRYFNSGVMLIDLDKVRADKLFTKALDFVARNASKLLFGDQDALNYTFWNKTAVLEPAWNVQRYMKPGEIVSETASDRRWGYAKPRLIHYLGTDKPWMRNVWHPWAWLYWENLLRTDFAKDVKSAAGMDFRQMLRLRLRWLLKQPGSVL